MGDMKSTLRVIKSHGYWVIHFKPTKNYEVENKNYTNLQQLVRNSAVQLRGWDVPHVPTSSAEHQDMYNIDDGIEAWCDFGIHKEVWRLFFDGEFIAYIALNEDWYQDDSWLNNQLPFKSIQPDKILNPIGSVMYAVTEWFEFIKRLIEAEHIKGDVKVHIELRNVLDRKLDLLDHMRVPLRGIYAARQNEIIAIDEVVPSIDLRQQSTKVASKAIIKILHMFQWNGLMEQQISIEQDKLFKREFY